MSVATAPGPLPALEGHDQWPDSDESTEWVFEECGTMGAYGDEIKTRLGGAMSEHCRAHGLGWALVETNVVFESGPLPIGFRPDVVFVARKRVPGGRLPIGTLKIVPDQTVEVVSEDDKGEDIEVKLNDYLARGVRLAWVVFPRARVVHVARSDGRFQRLRDGDVLDGEDVLPGFRFPLAELFGPRDAPSVEAGNET